MRQNFKSYMAAELNAYMEYRRGLGYVGTNLLAPLRAFDRYLLKTGDPGQRLPPSFFLEMRDSLQKNPKSVNSLLSALRGFFLFLVRQGLYEHSPVEDIPPLPVRAYVPFVFSPSQVEQLLQAASGCIRKTDAFFLQDLANYVVIVLLARCGMRHREPLRLFNEHYRPGEGTLYIEKTKFKKDRLIPVPKQALREMENYRTTRKTLLPGDDNPHLFVGMERTVLRMGDVYPFFYKAVKAMGLEKKEYVLADLTFGSVRPHSLRHSFAINTLKRIRGQGKDPQNALPVLSAYMGHAKYQYTAAYLKVLDAENLQGLIGFAKSQLDLV